MSAASGSGKKSGGGLRRNKNPDERRAGQPLKPSDNAPTEVPLLPLELQQIRDLASKEGGSIVLGSTPTKKKGKHSGKRRHHHKHAKLSKKARTRPTDILRAEPDSTTYLTKEGAGSLLSHHKQQRRRHRQPKQLSTNDNGGGQLLRQTRHNNHYKQVQIVREIDIELTKNYAKPDINDFVITN